jgi:hypothetical protein
MRLQASIRKLPQRAQQAGVPHFPLSLLCPKLLVEGMSLVLQLCLAYLQQRNQQRQKRKQRLTAKEGSMYEEEYLIQSLKQIIPTSKYQGMSPMEVNDSLDDFRGHWCGYQSTLVL